MIIKIVFIGLCTLICCSILKDYGTSFSVLVGAIGVCAIAYIIIPYISTIYEKCLLYFNVLNIDNDILKPVLKVTVIALMTKITAELCRDRGERALGFKIELAGVVAGIISSFPLLEKALGMINAL